MSVCSWRLGDPRGAIVNGNVHASGQIFMTTESGLGFDVTRNGVVKDLVSVQ